jgi:hypothetical protein
MDESRAVVNQSGAESESVAHLGLPTVFYAQRLEQTSRRRPLRK